MEVLQLDQPYDLRPVNSIYFIKASVHCVLANRYSTSSHGSWDSPEDQIGSYIYAHTNLTEIKDALNLFWRSDVPANRINLGLAFYGRSYTLEDPNCNEAGCPFSDPGVAGQCTVFTPNRGNISSVKSLTTPRALLVFFPTLRSNRTRKPINSRPHTTKGLQSNIWLGTKTNGFRTTTQRPCKIKLILPMLKGTNPSPQMND